MTTPTLRRTLGELRAELHELPVGLLDERPLSLAEYQRFAVKTYRGPAAADEKLEFLLLGLFGEVGSLLSELKKKQRDRSSYIAYNSSSIEETGDVLWYLANVVNHCGLSLGDLAGYLGPDAGARPLLDLQPQASLFHEPATAARVQTSLLTVAGTVGTLIARHKSIFRTDAMATDLASILSQLVSASTDAQISLAHAAHANLDKLMARWPVRRTWAPLLDAKDLPSEQFPRVMRVLFKELKVGRRVFTYQSMNDVNIGDRLTDNSLEEDDYRFHDVFHLAFAGILGWSPVLRTLLGVRRRSRPDVDEVQDGARAKITEEGLSSWVFSHGLRHEAFEHVDSLDFALLKTIAQMVKGYEAESLMPWMWEQAILEGFRVFRFLRENRGGLVTADLDRRCLIVEMAPKSVAT
jgi:NTP pyrophosphatase (non-canonical NTP hydrolase)